MDHVRLSSVQDLFDELIQAVPDNGIDELKNHLWQESAVGRCAEELPDEALRPIIRPQAAQATITEAVSGGNLSGLEHGHTGARQHNDFATCILNQGSTGMIEGSQSNA